MATTDTRSGFRLPWSSDRPHDELEGADAPDDATEPTGDAEESAPRPDGDLGSRPSLTSTAHRPDAATTTHAAPAPAPAASAARKPSKLMVDLAAAIRATTEQARDQRLGQLETDAGSVVELIRAQSVEGASALRRRADDDVAAIKEWAKAEIARIREESESRIGDRKHLLEREIEGHAAAIEDRVSVVETTVGDYRARINAYFARMSNEEDPSRLATMAEAMPEPPSLEPLAALDDLQLDDTLDDTLDDAPEATVETTVETTPEATIETPGEPDVPGADQVEATAEPAPGPGAATATGTGSPWGEAEPASPWGHASPAAETPATVGWDTPAPIDGPDPNADETPAGAGHDDAPADRDAIMTALEADAETVVAAESIAGAEEQADTALDREAQAAMSARVEASDFATASYAERLASLLPASAEPRTEGETTTTQVSVTGLVSVASIASFKRHLGRLPGVVAVAVASGPDGGFMFNVTHRPDVPFRDVIPTLPGFAARVTASGNGVVSVTAHDPETEA
jgi:hypothetical protein